MEPASATSVGSSIGSMLIYILMALILIIRPSGLFGKTELFNGYIEEVGELYKGIDLKKYY